MSPEVHPCPPLALTDPELLGPSYFQVSTVSTWQKSFPQALHMAGAEQPWVESERNEVLAEL